MTQTFSPGKKDCKGENFHIFLVLKIIRNINNDILKYI